MCQQWLSVAGLLADIIGFIFIAREWSWAINLQGAEKVRKAGMVYEKQRARREGRRYEEEHDDSDWEAWKQEFPLRRGLFRLGLVLVVLGFLGQALGSVPLSRIPAWMPTFGIENCS
jgi:hypothetical protein